MPEPGSVRPFDFPEVVSSVLPNGMEIRFARMGPLPLVTVMLVLDAGESRLEDARGGLAVLSGSCLEGGTLRRSGPDLAEALEETGASLSVRTGWDGVTVSLTCLADRLGRAMELLAETVLMPAFPGDEVARYRSQRLAAIQQRRMDPGSLADDAAAHFVFDPGVPYHRPLAGTKASVEALGPDEIREFAKAHHHPSGAGLVVVGDVEPGEVESLAREHFGAWEGPASSGEVLEVAPRFRERRIIVVDRPDSVQSEIRIGQVGVARDSSHFFPLKVFNTVLGGAFTSRLMLNLREKQGFTYGVRSRFSFRRSPGPFFISTAVGTEVTAPAVREAMGEVEGLLADGPAPDEIDQSRDFIVGVFPLRLETTAQVASRIAETLVYGLPEDFYATYRDRVRAVDAEAALESARAVLDPGRMVVVVVGDAVRIREPLEELKAGFVEVGELP
jgi:zinc protease